MILIVMGTLLVLLLIYEIQKLIPDSKKRILYSLVLIIFLLALTKFICSHVKLRSSYNYLTYITYELTISQLDEISTTTITDISSIRKLNNNIRTLQIQSSLLIEQLKYVNLVKGLNHQLSQKFNLLSNELQTLMVYHNRLFANTNDIKDDKIDLYESLIEETSQLYELLDPKRSVSKGNLVGIVEYTIIYPEGQLKRLDEALHSFSEVINKIIE